MTDAAREGARYAVIQDNTIKTTDDVKAKIEERLALASIESSTIEFSGDFHVPNHDSHCLHSARHGTPARRAAWMGRCPFRDNHFHSGHNAKRVVTLV